MMPKVVKKLSFPLFVVFLVIALFFSSVSHAGLMNTAEASFFDSIIALVTINPLRVRISTPAEVVVGRNFKAEVTVENRGKARINNAIVEVFISKGLVLVRKNSSREIGIISGNKEKKVFWQVKGIETGNFGISVRASGVVKGDAVSAEGNTAVVTVKEKSPPPGKFTNIFQSFFSFFQRWF